MKQEIIDFNKNLKIEYTGFTKLNGHTFIVCLFPYYTKQHNKSNISVYTHAKDYHIIIKDYLSKTAEFITKNFNAEIYGIYSDVSPYNDILLAKNAGLGIIGKNHLLINEKYGSFVFIGYIETNLEAEFDKPMDKPCLNCGNCIKKCPSSALKTNNFDICLSNITQKKGTLTQEEAMLIKFNGYAFGCDMCQLACPMNTFSETPIKEFKDNLMPYIEKSMFDNLSNKEFKNLFGDRAFSWRGKNVLLRNLDIISKE